MCFVLGLLIFLHFLPEQADKTKASQEQPKQGQNTSPPANPTPPIQQPNPERKENSTDSKPNQPSVCERIWAPVEANWPLVVVAIVGIWVAIGTLKVIARQTKAAEDAAETALLNTKAFIHSQRPWISIGISLESELLYDEQGAHITIGIAVQNVGQVPAMGVWINPAFFVPASAKHDVREERKRLCGEIAKTTEIGLVLFPGQPITQRFRITANASEIDAYCRSIFGDKAAEADMFSAYIIPVVGYRTAIDKDVCYFTAAIYELGRREPNISAFFVPKRETTPLESLQLRLFPIAGIIAE